MRSWKTTVEVTDADGNRGTVETPVCAPTENIAATGLITELKADGYTPVNGRVHMEPDGHCTHTR
ncbi:hypothetical protein [Streptomyces scabiei]|uniref:hypothetical protein n=1 Tax=Streptomyces scabiei TaxID=1930 RepID=UPI0029BF6655|nr:hypothetical protein [Streptomyces scabiei]MDX3520736.1 hypothetical protein [Streptomyces scabiei]